MKTRPTIFKLFSIAVIAVLMLYASPPAYSCFLDCPAVEHARLQQIIENRHIEVRELVSEEMKKHQLWFMGSASSTLPGKGFFADFVAPAMTLMTESLTVTGMHQMFMLGQFFDASHQLETQRLMQEMVAEAHKDYHVSTDLCTIGTGIRGLGAAHSYSTSNAAILLKQAQDRQLGYVNTTTTDEDLALDRQTRLAKFKDVYCDPNDFDSSLASVCTTGGSTTRLNRDIDYSRQMGVPRTINVDLTDTVITDEEEDLFALSTYLFAHSPPPRVSEAMLLNPKNHDEYLDLRALVAKRSILLNSFHNIAGLKTRSSAASGQTGEYVAKVFDQLGMPAGEAQEVLGERPSYYALMEVLAQKIYQDPEFFTNLYDKPANVMRKDVAMQAIDLMLGQDLYYSELRTESMFALWLELETMEYQDAVQNRAGWLDDEMEEN